MNPNYTSTPNKILAASKKLFSSLLVLALALVNDASAQTATTANVSGTTSVNTINNNTASVVDAGLTLTANGNITGFVVTITGSYTNGDVLSYTGTLPSGVSASSFSTSTRSLVFSGTTSAANWQALLRTVTLRTTSAVCNPESRQVSFIVGNKYYNPLNGHFYEYYSTGKSWSDARNIAATNSYFGREGYLATITSQAENSFISVLIGQNSWIGCSDNYLQVNAALGYNAYASQAACDGNFHWVTGPERGRKMISKNAWMSGGITPVSGVYNNWASGEPNDWPNLSTSTPGEEDYGHMYTSSGTWNDFPNGSQIGSVFEYGDMPNDQTSSQVVFTRSIYINGAPSGTITGGNVTKCAGTNSTVLTLTGLTGTVVRWESSLDNFLTAGTTISSTSSSITVSNISNTTYYRAVVNTSGGCSNLATSSTPIFVSNTVTGNIVAANNTICAGSDVEFTLFGNSGSVVKWQVSTTSNFSSGVTDISNTTTSLNYMLNSTGTYYFRAAVQNNGCGSPSFTAGYTITVVSGTAPVGGVVSSTEHCGGSSNSGTLTLSGYTGTINKWQYSTDGGIIWTDVNNTTATLNYTGVGTNRIYRVKLTNGSCGSAYSGYGTVTVYGTTVSRWDGGTSSAWQLSSNWCGGVADNGIDVVINTSAPNDLILDKTRIIGHLDFNGTSRIINIGNYDLTVDNITDANSNSFIRTPGTGKLKMNVANGTSKTFPVGNSAYNPLTVTNNSGSADYVTVRIIDEVYNNGYTGYTSSLPRVKRTWDIHKQNPNGGSGLTFVFNWNNNEAYNLSNATLYHYENGVWNKQTGTTSSTSNSLTYSGYTGTFSPFAIGSGLTPLPVKLVSFEAIKQEATKSVLLTWQTSEEKDNMSFDVQRSVDGINWVTIGTVETANNSSVINDYSFVDRAPSAVNFYRLKQNDLSGDVNYSEMRKVDFNTSDNQLVSIYPNPSKGSVTISVAEVATYSVMDINGQVISEGEVNGEVKLNELPVGIYMVRVLVGEEVRSFKLLIQ